MVRWVARGLILSRWWRPLASHVLSSGCQLGHPWRQNTYHSFSASCSKSAGLTTHQWLWGLHLSCFLQWSGASIKHQAPSLPFEPNEIQVKRHHSFQSSFGRWKIHLNVFNWCVAKIELLLPPEVADGDCLGNDNGKLLLLWSYLGRRGQGWAEKIKTTSRP